MNKNNFYNSTLAFWSESSEPERRPDYTSESGSKYWYTSLGVYRKSDHWGVGVSSCNWLIKDDGYYDLEIYENEIIAFCKWSDFKCLKFELDYIPDWFKYEYECSTTTFIGAYSVLKNVSYKLPYVLDIEAEIKTLINNQIIK